MRNAISVFLNRREAEFLIVLAYHVVSVGWSIDPDEPADTALARATYDFAQHHLLDTAPEYPAANIEVPRAHGTVCIYGVT